ncbi:MAG TPA: amidase [Vicinamibacterales bacterium]|nr:amidase [Vicinamibacterales bacterium]
MTRTAPRWSLSASELVALYRTGGADPVAVLDACFERIDAVNPQLNAIVTMDRPGSRVAAEAARARWARRQPASPLDGVPFTVKDNLHVAGMRATWGSLLFADFVPEQDDLSIARLRSGGAVLLGKTNTPEFSLAGHTDNRLFGSTGNPWDPELTPGGSSGGAVAAVMSGMAPIAIATDAGGSIRRPASHTGCVGLKTSIGRVPRRHGFPPLAGDLQTVGVLARSVADVRTTLEVMAGPAPRQETRSEALEIAAFAQIPGAPVDPAVLGSFEAAVARIEALGHSVEIIDAPYDPEDMGALMMGLASAGIACVMDAVAADRRGLTSEPIARLADAGSAMTAAEYVALAHRVADFRWLMHDLFENRDLLLTPTAAALPWPRGTPFPATIAGVRAGPRASAIFTTFVNVAGIAAISLPAEPAPSGLPIGIQLAAPPDREAMMFHLGAELEHHHPWPRVAGVKASSPTASV